MFSIICPTYNSEKFIKNTIDSILDQRFSKYEVEDEDKLQQFGNDYCKNAIYKNNNDEFETCSYNKATVKGKPFGKKGSIEKKKAKDSLEGAFNILWGPGENKDKYLFWKVNCIENPST